MGAGCYEPLHLEALPQIPQPQFDEAPLIEPIHSVQPMNSAAVPRVRVEKLPATMSDAGGFQPSSRRGAPALETTPGDSNYYPELMGPMGYDGIDVSARPRAQR